MVAQTIDLTSISPDYSNELLKLDFNYGQVERIRHHLQTQFIEQKKLSDNIFSEWLIRTNSNLIEGLDNFMADCLEEKEGDLFPRVHSKLIHPANIVLGLQTGDHYATINMMEDHIRAQRNSITVLRIKPDISKKSQLLNVLDSVKKVDNLLVIVERAEATANNLIEILVSALYTRINYGEVSSVIILFCISGSWTAINKRMPIDVVNRMSQITTIVKDPDNLVENMHKMLLDTKTIKFKLGHHLISLIADNFIEDNPSISNLKYLYQYSLFLHYLRYSSSFTNSSRKTLRSLFKTEPILIKTLKNLKSICSRDIVELNDSKSSANFCLEKVQYIMDYNCYIWTQISYYLDLLRDETGNSFPGSLIDIYQELLRSKHDNLAHSVQFVEAIDELRFYPIDRIIKRIEYCTREKLSYPERIENIDVYDILVKYRDKLNNNDDCKSIVKELVNDLHLQAQELKNLLKLEMNESLYFNDGETLRKRALPSTRFDALQDCYNKHCYYELLFNIIKNSREKLNQADLFDDFKRGALEMNCVNLKENTPSKSIETKTTAKKFKRSMKQPIEVEEKIEDSDEGLLKAIFIDLISAIEYQGLIKANNRRSQRGTLNRCLWL